MSKYISQWPRLLQCAADNVLTRSQRKSAQVSITKAVGIYSVFYSLVICFDCRHRLELKRRHGLLDQTRGRNPLNAEKTPRDNEHFEYQPPPAAKQEERWHYPDTDWGLMAKFRSQKQVYDDIYAKEKEYHSQVDRVQQIREQNQRMIQEEFERQKAVYDMVKKQKEESDQARFKSIMSLDSSINSGQSSSRHSKAYGVDELDLALQKDAEEAAKAEEARRRKKKGHSGLLTLTHKATPPKDFYHTKISNFKNIGAILSGLSPSLFEHVFWTQYWSHSELALL